MIGFFNFQITVYYVLYGMWGSSSIFLEGAIKEFRGFKANMFVFVDIELRKPMRKSILHQ